MPLSTGADLPPETISKVLSYFTIIVEREGSVQTFRRWKHELVAPSLVCKHWAECIRPTLFQDILLRNAYDVALLKTIVFSPQFIDSSLNGAIKSVRAQHQFPPLPEPWLHHLHPLMARLPETSFRCVVWRETHSQRPPILVRWPPFAALPRIPPSFYRLQLSSIQLTGSELKNTTELARLIDSFPTLEQCCFSQLRFRDPSTAIQARRIPRKVPRAFWSCEISECTDMAISSAATLALDLLAAAPRLGLQAEDAQWITILDVLLESVPTRFQQARMSLCRFEGEMLNGHTPDGVVLGFSPNEDQDEDYISASVWVKPGHDTEKHSPAHVNQISLIAGFVVAGDAGPQSFDALRDIVDSPHFDELRFWVREGNALDEQGTRSLLRSLLRREQLTWALERGILWLQLCSHIHDETDDWDEVIVFDSSVLLSVLADRSYPVIDDTPQTLDDTEYAELLSLFNVQKMNDYLRRLPALRAERAAAKARSMVETSDSPGTQNAAAIALPAGAAGEVVDRYEEAARAQEGEDHGVKS